MAAAILWVYLEHIAPAFGYLGYTARRIDGGAAILLLLVSSLTAAALPTRAENPAQFIIVILYYFLFLPSLVIVPLHGYLETSQAIAVWMLVLVSFGMMVAASSTRLRLGIALRLSPRLFWGLFALAWLALNLIVVAGFGGRMRLVGFDDIYAQRELAKSGVTSTLVWYASGFLANAFNPFLLSLGLAARRWWMVAVAVAGQVMLFATAAEKIVLVTVPLVIVFYVVIFDRNRFSLLRVGLLTVAGSLAFVPMLLLVDQAGEYEMLVRHLISLVYLRTFCTTGAMLAVYADFFSTQPWTLWSHTMVGAPFSAYPYDVPLGEVIGDHVTGGSLYLNANAGFLATDGFAALGHWGVIIISALIAFFLFLIAVLFGDRHLPVICGTLLPYAMGLANTSFFTSLLTGGGAITLVLLLAWQMASPSEQAPTGRVT